MSVPKERLIESAVRPLEDNAEMHLTASRLLGALVPEDALGTENAVARWDAVDARPRKSAWRILLWAMLLIISAVVGFHAVRVLVGHQDLISGSPAELLYGYPPVTDESVAANLTEEQRLLVFGDLSRSEEWERMKVLWESDPDNPAYFARYAGDYISKTNSLPPDFLKIAGEIDPENAWFTYIAAGVTARDSVKRRAQTKPEKLSHKAFEWDILDQTRFDQSIAILRHARNQPRCDSYFGELLEKQLSFIPRSTPQEAFFSCFYPYRSYSGRGGLRYLADVICTAAWLSGENEDIDGFHQALADADEFLRKRANVKVDSFGGELINLVGAAEMTSNLSAAADKLDLNEESERLGKIQQRFLEMIVLKESRKSSPTADLLYDKGGMLTAYKAPTANLTFKFVKSPPPLTEADVKPGRLVDQEMSSWVWFHLGWLALLVCCAMVFCYRYWTPPMIRRLAARLEKLMSATDWLWVLGVGIVIPLLAFLAVTRFTTLGGRDLSIERTSVNWRHIGSFPLSFGQFAGLAVTMFLLTVAICRWRINQRAGFLAISQKWDWALWPAITCAVLFVPCIGWAVIHVSDAADLSAKILSATALLYLVTICSFVFFSNTRAVLRAALIARMLVPAFAFAALLFISAAPVFKLSALRWFERDRLLKPSHDDPHWTEFERANALQLRKELRARMGYDE